MKKKLEQLKKLLADAETLAKEIADAAPMNGPAQSLRARVHAAGELAAVVVIDDEPEVKPEPVKK